MYGQTLRVHDEYLAKDMDVPRNTAADGNGSVQRLSGTLGSVEIIAEVASELALAEGKELTVTMMHSDGDGAEFIPLGTVCQIHGNAPLPAGEVLGRYVLPTHTRKEVKVRVECTDPAADGKLSVFPQFLAR
ncbi:hypothetical protein [Desulfobaculum bizertense]|uniref:Uncharacterized protein n=1 Tax=Desulfobaculum bizertense DSM 18034 TaxID=1121442 RepID=A0A1T4VGU5_9BACT|nr:hypothetical protein [Desulfobaculum bizertense]SKA64155.1 hypothetical protein SAMN02745702_00277 [Desulfobaculum bizertense DSM 18034]